VQAKITQFFQSIQGEGKYVGRRQTFIRFFGCNLQCEYCDTRLTRFRNYSVEEVKRKVVESKVKSLSLTGGEPLMQVDFLKEFLPKICKEGFEIYLETNATLSRNLKEIIEFMDIISFDIKLKSSTQQPSQWRQQEEFFSLAKSKEVFFKTVITPNTEMRDIEIMAQFMEDKLDYTLYLQPDSRRLTPSLIKLVMYFQEYLLDKRIDVRVLPQVHKFLKIP